MFEFKKESTEGDHESERSTEGWRDWNDSEEFQEWSTRTRTWNEQSWKNSPEYERWRSRKDEESRREQVQVRSMSIQTEYQYSYWRSTPRFTKTSATFVGAREQDYATSKRNTGYRSRSMMTQSQTTSMQDAGAEPGNTFRFEPLRDKMHGAWEVNATC